MHCLSLIGFLQVPEQSQIHTSENACYYVFFKADEECFLLLAPKFYNMKVKKIRAKVKRSS